MFTDLVGYTALTQRDEAAAMRLLEEHRRTVRPFFTLHGGSEVKTIGDAFLVEFGSALEAVRCAYEIQQSIHELDSGKTDGAKATVRIGVHVGDVIHDKNDVYGDAVNVASRIEPLAQPGGICVSRQVYDHVKNKFEFPIVSIGQKELKNVSEPLEVFKVVLPWEGSGHLEASLDRRRIAVLPFSNISPDPADEYFADGMTEELTATMSRIGGLKVIARTSVMGYKGTQKKISDVARELEVGTVLEGSVRKAGDRVRITIQLIDSKTSEHLWAESYERELKDVFAIQSEVSKVVAESLKVHLTPQEKVLVGKEQTESTEAHTVYLKGRFYWNERTEENTKKALAYFERAVAADPGFALAYSGISDCYNVLVDYGWMDPAKALPLSEKNARRAIELDESLAEGHASLGSVLASTWKFRAAESEFKRAIELRPSYSPAYHWFALMLNQLGRPEEAFQRELDALDIDPYSMTSGLGACVALYIMGRYSEALTRLTKLAQEFPEYVGIAFWKSTVHLVMEEFDDAVRDAERAVELSHSPSSLLNLAGTLAYVGRREDALKAYDQAKQEGFASPAFVGMVELMLGMNDEGFGHLEEAVRLEDTSLLTGRHDPINKKYLTGPRWKAIDEEITRLISR